MDEFAELIRREFEEIASDDQSQSFEWRNRTDTSASAKRKELLFIAVSFH